MNEEQLTTEVKSMVLITRIGDVFVTNERGKKIMFIRSKDPNGLIEIDGNFYSAHVIEGLINLKDYESLQYRRRGMWQCKKQRWHARDDSCYCLLNEKLKEVKFNKPKPEMDDEARKRASVKFQEMKKTFFNRKRKSSNEV